VRAGARGGATRARGRESGEKGEIFSSRRRSSSFVVDRSRCVESRPHRIASHRTGRADAIAREGSRDADDEARDEARESADAEFGGGIIK
jgi:hypothetical protein